MEETGALPETPETSASKKFPAWMWLVIAVVLAGLLIFLFLRSKNKTASSGQSLLPQGVNSNQGQEVVAEKVFTLEEISKHSTKDDCWIAIDGSVYDVTSFIPEHPGGDKILLGCGKDASELYATKGGTGVPHSEQANKLHESFKIGILSKN